jgi:hypothetical protein
MAKKKGSDQTTLIEWGTLNPEYDNVLADNFEKNDVQWLTYTTNKLLESTNSDDEYIKRGIIERVEKDPNRELPAGTYRCKVRWVEGEIIQTVESLNSETESSSHSLTNLRRTYEGKLPKKPQIGQECTIRVPRTNLRHIDGEILELHNKFWYPTGGNSRKRSSKKSGQNASKAGGATPPTTSITTTDNQVAQGSDD